MAKKVNEEIKEKDKQSEVSGSKNSKKAKKKTVVYNVPPKKPKKSRSEKIRIAMCVFFTACIVCLTMPFTTFNIVRTMDTDEGVENYQKKIDKACEELKKAEEKLVLADEEEVEENKSLEKSDVIYPHSLSDDNIIKQKCETKTILKEIEKAAQIDRIKYTKESYDNLLEKIYNASGIITSTAVISDTGLQLIFGTSLSDTAVNRRTEGVFQRLLYSIGFLVVPAVGFFIASFDKKRHIKNIFAIVGSMLLIFDIFAFFPLQYIDYGAVISVVLYVIIFLLGVAGFYTKQQEDYWTSHYEECVEKGMTKWLPDGYIEDKKNAEQIKADKEHQALVDAAKNAQKRRSKKK